MFWCKQPPGGAYYKPYVRTCVICGGQFTATSNSVKACYGCRDRYYVLKAKQKKLEARVTKCEVCGLTFVPSRSGAKYCSDRCKQAAYRERKAQK